MDNNTYNKIPVNRSVNKGSPKLFIYILLIIIFLIGFFFTYNLLLPAIFPKMLRGDLQNITAFPSANGKIKLWIQTDPTLHFSSKSGNPGQYGAKTKGMFCRIFSYVYDPLSKDVELGMKTSFDDLPPSSYVVYEKGKIWVVTSSAPPELNVYSSDNYQEVLNTKSFCERNKELSAGIENLSVDYSLPVKLHITTKDGKEMVYSIADDKFFGSTIELGKYYSEIDSSVSSVFTLDNELNSDKRKKLYYFTGPKYKLYFSMLNGEDFIRNKNSGNNKLYAVEILPSKVFIEGELLYSDEEIAVILHQNNIGRTADRILTCIDKSGKELWIIQQKDLFKKMKGIEDDSMTEMSFMRTRCAAQRLGSVIAFMHMSEGAMGIDLFSGKKLWEFEQ